MSTSKPDSAITRWLSSAKPASFAVYAIIASFGTYFCMYAFRKPFTAAEYEGLQFFGGTVGLKTALVTSQIIGYTVSKFLGIKVVSERVSGNRAAWLIGLIVFAELALLLFGVLPDDYKVVALFLNGLPLGMVWGMCVAYLEGRRLAELLLAGLSCSFIVSSGVVKDVGKWLLTNDVSEFWMPALTGLLFLPLYVFFVWMLDKLPRPDAIDIEARNVRGDMLHDDRMAFVHRFLPGLVLMLTAYFFLTAYRDFRDNYGAEIFQALGYGEEPGIFTKTELPVSFVVMAAMGVLFLVKDNKRGLIAAFSMTIFGAALLALGTAAFQAGVVDGAVWMILTGVGGYLCYVPFGSALFERIMAHTRFVGTAVFAIYVADALGYSGSIATMLFKDILFGGTSRLSFFIGFSYFMAALGVVLLLFAMVYFVRQGPAPGHETRID